MTETLIHRGPDGEGSHVCGNVALGHRRLAIIDLETGKQPLFSEDGAVAVIFNGEIYNYLELRQELMAAGHNFQTSSDSEVLVHGYEEWGLDLVTRLNGMWAFALWDRRCSRLMLSRDRIGEKPLYYAIIDDTLVFGSELKAIIAYGTPLARDLSVLELYLTLGYVPSPFTFLKDVRKLEPGWCLLAQNGDVSQYRYWDLPAVAESEMNRDWPSVCQQFESLLRDSVRMRMRSDVAFGAFLSGGLDSTSIVSLMAEASSRPVQTFTIGFNQAELDERPIAREVARKFGTQHYDQILDYPGFEDAISRILHYTDEPFGDSSCLPTERVAAYARQRVKMALSGDGGDEVLSGYNSYQSERLAGYLAWAPQAVIQGLAGLAWLAGRPLTKRIRQAVAHTAKVIRLCAVPFEARLLQKAWADVTIVRAILADITTPQVPVDDFLADFFRRCPWRDPFYQLMYYNIKSSLPEDMLTKVDRMSMANSLEVRTPFLDHRLVALMTGVHKEVKLPHFVRKAVLRHTVAMNLPKCVRHARKRGFVTPVRKWFAGERGAALVESGLRDCPLALGRDVVRAILDDNRKGKVDYGNFIWMLLMLTAWLKQ